MSTTPLSVETFEEARPRQDLSGFELESDEVVGLLSMYDPYGVWRIDLDTGHVYWSDDVFRIHGLDPRPGPVNLKEAINAYHPDDARVIGQLIDDCIKKQSGFRFVLRLRNAGGGYNLVKSIGRYRENSRGEAQMIGLFSRFALPMRSIAAVE